MGWNYETGTTRWFLKLLIYSLLVLILTGCASALFIPYNIERKMGKVVIKTNIPEEVIYKNKAGGVIKIKSS